jgi:N-acetylmuramoyl-L-alanine amidase
LLVVHTAEGSRTIESLGSYFASSSSEVSSHTGADDKPNTVGEFVRRPDKAWTQGNANPVAVSIELCGFAAWTSEWDQHPDMLANCAAWLAEESAALGVPLVKLSPADAQGGGRGVCSHSDLGSWGGGHSDPGGGFPWARVLDMAGGSAPAEPATPTPPPATGDAPPFPLPPGYYYGPADGPTESVSGYYPPYGGAGGAPGLRQWQAQVGAIAADGFYGPETEGAAYSVQSAAGIDEDGLIGPDTWRAAWD